MVIIQQCIPTNFLDLDEYLSDVSWKVVLVILSAMDVTVVRKAGDTMTGHLNTKSVVVMGGAANGNIAGWRLKCSKLLWKNEWEYNCRIGDATHT